uniref:PP28 domain-containing protein n=1 Tax=Steinernema glaseri TaxID=37863 RepID=A0A1I8ATY8_9BILA
MSMQGEGRREGDDEEYKPSKAEKKLIDEEGVPEREQHERKVHGTHEKALRQQTMFEDNLKEDGQMKRPFRLDKVDSTLKARAVLKEEEKDFP